MGPAESRIVAPEGYAGLTEDAAWAEVADRGLLEVRGPDASDFLQRILASDAAALEPGHGQWSALLDGRGHWVTEAILFRDPVQADVFLLDLPEERLEPVAQRLETLHFAEDLTLAPHAEGAGRLLVAGPRAAARLGEAELPVPDAGDGFGITALGDEGLVLRRADRGVPAWEVIAPTPRREELRRSLRDAGVAEASPEALETVRIEAFQPKWGVDLTEAETLPVSDEWRRASLAKGCYPGQEVVARVNTYGEAPRRLVRLFADAPIAGLSGAELLSPEGRRLGEVRSWTVSPRHGVGVGLGLVRRRAARDGFQLVARMADDGASVSVRLAEPA